MQSIWLSSKQLHSDTALNFLSALAALTAAVFWFLSAYPSLPMMVSYWGYVTQSDTFFHALKWSARMSAIAAVFAGLSAALFAFATLLNAQHSQD